MPPLHRLRGSAVAGAVLAAVALGACESDLEDPPAGPPVTEDPAGEAPGATGEGS